MKRFLSLCQAEGIFVFPGQIECACMRTVLHLCAFPHWQGIPFTATVTKSTAWLSDSGHPSPVLARPTAATQLIARRAAQLGLLMLLESGSSTIHCGAQSTAAFSVSSRAFSDRVISRVKRCSADYSRADRLGPATRGY